MGTRAHWKNSMLRQYDGYETIFFDTPVQFSDDFNTSLFKKIVSNENTVATWTTNVTGSGGAYSAPVKVANAANGIVTCALGATDEAQRSLVYFGDQLPFNINYGLVFEARAALAVNCTTGTEKALMLLGLAGAHNNTPDTVATNLWFMCAGDANIYWESDDGTTDDDDNDSGVDSVAGTYHIYRIDCTVATAPAFYIDDVLVGTASGTWTSGSTAKVQPYFGVTKLKSSANTGVGTLYVDYIKCYQRRS